MLWDAIKMAFSPLLLPHTILIGTVSYPFRLLPTPSSMVLLFESVVVVYQYTAMAAMWGAFVGCINLVIFYIVGRTLTPKGETVSISPVFCEQDGAKYR